MLNIKKRINYKQETEVVTDTTSKTRPDTWRSVSEWVDRLTDWSDIELDMSEQDVIEDIIDTAYQDKLELAQIAQDLKDSVVNTSTSSPLAEQNNAEATPEADDDGEVKPSSTDDKSIDD